MPTEVKDKLAEKGIGMTNLLLGMLILLGGIFGTTVTDSMKRMNDSVDEVGKSISALQLTSGLTNKDVAHLRSTIDDHSIRLNKLEDR